MNFKTLLLVFLSASSMLFATPEKEEFDESNFFYLKVDNCMNINTVLGVCSPFIGMGERQIFGKNGTDINFGVELEPMIRSKFNVMCWDVNVNYLRFLKAERKNKYYVGAGATLMGFYTSDLTIFLKSPTFILGKHIYEGDRLYIVQLKINWPHHESIRVEGLAYHIPKYERLKRIWAAQIFITTGVSF